MGFQLKNIEHWKKASRQNSANKIHRNLFVRRESVKVKTLLTNILSLFPRLINGITAKCNQTILENKNKV